MILDFDMPKYRFSPGQLSCEKDKNGYKNILNEAFDELNCVQSGLKNRSGRMMLHKAGGLETSGLPQSITNYLNL